MINQKFKITGSNKLDSLLEQINNGADINIEDVYGNTALILASRNDHTDICKILIENGANINIQNKSGTTALIKTSISGNIEICKLLIDNGANVNLQDNDCDTALIWASLYKMVDICKLLIENNTDINIKDKFDKTAIDIMKSGGIYKEVNPYKLLGIKYFKDVFKGHAEAYMDIFETTLYTHDLELEDIKANIEMFYSTVVARMDNNTINEDVEL